MIHRRSRPTAESFLVFYFSIFLFFPLAPLLPLEDLMAWVSLMEGVSYRQSQPFLEVSSLKAGSVIHGCGFRHCCRSSVEACLHFSRRVSLRRPGGIETVFLPF